MKKRLLNCLVYIVLLCLLVLYNFSFGVAEVKGISMKPTLVEGDLLFLRKTNKVTENNIIAVYSKDLDELLVKRVIGVEGDHIVLNKDGLYVNGELKEENYILDSDWQSNSSKAMSIDLTVEKGDIFVMGDNRNNSTDSRILGCLSVSDIYGVCLLNVTDNFGFKRVDMIRFMFVFWLSLILIYLIGVYRKRRVDNGGFIE